MGRSKPRSQSSATRIQLVEHIKETSSQKINKFNIKKEKTTRSTTTKLNCMQMDPPGGRRRLGRGQKVSTPESESSLSPVDADSSNDASGCAGSSECRRSSRKKTIKFDVRDLLNKNRKNHKIQIEARIDSNAPKLGAGQASKEELDNKQKTFIEKSAIFRRYSISENKLLPRPPPPPVALIQTIQQCVGELDQLPLDGDIDLAAISPIARRLSRTQDILSASMMKPKQVSSLIVTKLESSSTPRVAPSVRRPNLQDITTSLPPKRRGRPPKFKAIAKSFAPTNESSNDSAETSGTTDTSETNALPSTSSNSSAMSFQEPRPDVDSVPNGREVSVSPDSSTKGIDLKEQLDASAVTLPQPTILDDCMLVSTDDLFVAAEEEVFTEALSSDDSTIFLRSSPTEKNVDISLFNRSDSTETNSSDDSEQRRKKVRISVKRVALSSTVKDRFESTSKYRHSKEKSEIIEILSSNDEEASTSQDDKYASIKEVSDVVDNVVKISKIEEESSQDKSKSISTRSSHKMQVKQCPTQPTTVMKGFNYNSTTLDRVVELSSDSATHVGELLGPKKKSISPTPRMIPTRRAKSCKRGEVPELSNDIRGHQLNAASIQVIKETTEVLKSYNDKPTANKKGTHIAAVALHQREACQITEISPAELIALQQNQASTVNPLMSPKDMQVATVSSQKSPKNVHISLRSRKVAQEQANPPMNIPTDVSGSSNNEKNVNKTGIPTQENSREEVNPNDVLETLVPVHQNQTSSLVSAENQMNAQVSDDLHLQPNLTSTPKAIRFPEQNQTNAYITLRSRKEARPCLPSAVVLSKNRKSAHQETGSMKNQEEAQEELVLHQNQPTAHVSLRSRRHEQDQGNLAQSSSSVNLDLSKCQIEMEEKNPVLRHLTERPIELVPSQQNEKETTVLPVIRINSQGATTIEICEKTKECDANIHVSLRDAEENVRLSLTPPENPKDTPVLFPQKKIVSLRSRPKALQKESVSKKADRVCGQSDESNDKEVAAKDMLQNLEPLCIQSEPASPKCIEITGQEKPPPSPNKEKPVPKVDEKSSEIIAEYDLGAVTKLDEKTSAVAKQSVVTVCPQNEHVKQDNYLKTTTGECTYHTNTDTVGAGRRESLRAAMRASIAPLKKVTPKESSKTLIKSAVTHRTSSTSDSSEDQKNNSKGCRPTKANVVDKSEENSSVCSESSSNTSSSSSSSSASSSSSSLPSSSSQCRDTRLRKTQATLENPLESHRVTPQRKAKSGSESEKSTRTEKQSRKSEEQFTEPESESSENRTKQRLKTSKDEKNCGALFKDRAKLIQRRKSVRMNRWTTTLAQEEETNETGSESSEPSLPPIRKTRSARSRGRTDAALISEGSTGSNPDENPSKGAQQSTFKVEETKIETNVNEPASKADIQAISTNNKVEELRSSQIKNSNKTCTSKEDSGPITTDVAGSRTKSRRRTKKLIPLKDSSSDSNNLSDNETSSSGNSSARLELRNTRARRKTISNAGDYNEIFMVNLSPPDKALEYISPKSSESAVETKSTRQSDELMKTSHVVNSKLSEDIDDSTTSNLDLKKKQYCIPSTSDESTKKIKQRGDAYDTKPDIDPEGECTDDSKSLELQQVVTTHAEVFKPGEQVNTSSDNSKDLVHQKVTQPKAKMVLEPEVMEQTSVEVFEPVTSKDLAAEELMKISRQKNKTKNSPETSDLLNLVQPLKTLSRNKKSPAKNKETLISINVAKTTENVEDNIIPGSGCISISTDGAIPVKDVIQFVELSDVGKSQIPVEEGILTSIESISNFTHIAEAEKEKSQEAVVKRSFNSSIKSDEKSLDATYYTGPISSTNVETTEDKDPSSTSSSQKIKEKRLNEPVEFSSIASSIFTTTTLEVDTAKSDVLLGLEATLQDNDVKNFVLSNSRSISIAKDNLTVEKGASKPIEHIQKPEGLCSVPPKEIVAEGNVKSASSSTYIDGGGVKTSELLLVSKELASDNTKEFRAFEEKHEQVTLCIESSQHKTELSKKKFVITEKAKNPENLDEVSKELLSKHTSSESNQSDDSLKAELKLAPRRQLDSSFIESLEKSLRRPICTKKLSKKKEKDTVTTPSPPKDKEEPQNSKKKQDFSPKSKKKQKEAAKIDKKQKEAPKIDKKLEDTSFTKRKSVPKTKEPESAKPDSPKSQTPTTFSISNEAMPSVEAPFHQEPSDQKVEIPDSIPNVFTTNKEEINNQEQQLPPEVKEKSPDLIPDPLKDIEKFIEDGVNLLKRGYKLDDDEEETIRTRDILKSDELITPKKCKIDYSFNEEKKESPREDDNSNSECSTLTTTPTTELDTPNGIRRSHRIKNNSKSTKCLVGRGLVRDKERFSTKDDEKTVYSIDDQKMDLAEVEAKNSKFLKEMEERLSNFRVIRENEYKCERVISKEAKRMLCDCFLTPEEEERGELGCGEDCLNRLLMIECGSDCTVRVRCTNRRFTKFLYSPCRVFRTEKKGFGIMADIEILAGEFIMEYVGEVINGDEFENRRNAYSQEKNKHYYFMALRSDAIIDATAKGNISRFINHSCDPNAETQKWTVNGELRIGFFSRKSIMPGEEITFDYQYQRYGKEAQKCYCESVNCRGWIGEEPSSEEEEEELDEDEEESEETEEEEERPLPDLPIAVPSPIPVDEQLVPVVPVTSEVTVISKDVEAVIGEDIMPPVPVAGVISAETTVKLPEVLPKKKKEKKRLLERKEEKIKRRETKQFLEDPDIEDEVRFLVKCGLKNQADTLRLSRLIVRAKLLETRLKLLQILRNGELPCRRLFLDYHGLRLLHGWMSEVIDTQTQDTEKSMEIRMVLLSVLECLPISNKTLLTDSKVYQTVRDWSNNKESHSPSYGSPKDTNASSSSPPGTEYSSSELQKLAAKLVNTWDNLPEIFRIPKRERIEQMKEHEREADRQYKGLGEDESQAEGNRNRDRFMRNTGPNSSRFKWSRSDKDKERERTGDRRKYTQNVGPGKDISDKASGTLPGDSHLSKEQRREMFAAKVARDEAEKRLCEERREFDIKCRFFGIDPKRMRPENMPFCVNPSTGQWYSTNRKPIATPPSYAHVQVPVKPKSTNPEDYRLPQMDLPPLWKFAISPSGKIYYYHVKIRIPQWEPPIKILPLAGQNNVPLKSSESDSSNAECVDSSEDDIEVIKGLDPVKLQTYIEKKIEGRRLQRYTRLVEEKPISPRKEEDRIYNQMEVRKYKENKEKIRKRKEEIRRRRDLIVKVTSMDLNSSATSNESVVEAIPIQDYLLSSDEEEAMKADCNNSPLIDKIVQGDKIVDELDALQSKRPFKRALPIREKYEHKKRKLDKGKDSSKSTKRNKDGDGISSSKYRKIREKFRCEIAGIIVQHLKPYRKETCFSGRILTDDDFNHLSRKLTHFVMVKELKYCESIGQTLVVTESVKNKSREFIKKYMAKYDAVYVRPKNDPEFKDIPFL